MGEFNGRLISFEKTIELLTNYSIPLIPYRWVRSPEEAKREVYKGLNFPAVVKIITTSFPHKSEVGLVMLDLMNPEAVEQAVQKLVERLSGIPYEGILIQEQASSGIEVIVGVSRDEQFGPVVAFGAGGIFVEFLEDTVLGIPPLTHRLAREMIEQTKISKLLKGVRGRKPADIPALVDLIVKVSCLAKDNEEWIEALDLNPVVVYEAEKGLQVLDFRLYARDKR